MGTLYGPAALQVEIERFNRIMKKIEVEGTFTSDISIDMADLSKNIKEESVQPTGVTSMETACETVVSSVEIEVEEQEIEYAPEHKKFVSTEEEIVVPAPVLQVEIPQRNISSQFKNLPFNDISENVNKEKDDWDLGD